MTLKGKDEEIAFRRKAEQLGYEVRDYSGRGMFGRECPSVTVDNPYDFIAEIGMKGLKIVLDDQTFVSPVGVKGINVPVQIYYVNGKWYIWPDNLEIYPK